ncbi:MAG: hypothetical protein D6696_03195 [Acidobacteria bacterium]|nr:MAG: hypothetical protein D6696_03195 [Acidobacteriota bacterium]
MRHYAYLAGAMMLAFALLFAVVEALELPLLSDPEPLLAGGGAIAAAAGVGLLIADVALPVPASLVMIAHGALFGVAAGTALSLAGGLGAALFGFWIGRRGGPLVARLVPEDERRRAGALLARWGPLAIVVSRPVPIVAETVAILAGTSPLGWVSLSAASVAGLLPAALLYALTGATAARLDHASLIFALVLAIAALLWLLGRRLRTDS